MMVGSRDPLHHSRYAGEMTQGVAFQSSAPPAQTRNAPAICCHAACCKPPAIDLLRVLSLMGIRGGIAKRRKLNRSFAARLGESVQGRVLLCAVATLFCESATGLRFAEKSLEMFGDLRF